jgi:hypothetical protein
MGNMQSLQERGIPMCAATTWGNHTVRIQFGEVCCALTCHDVDIFERLRNSFDIFLSDQPIDITVELYLVGQLDLETLETVPSHKISLPQEKLVISKYRAYHIEFDAAGHRLLVIAERSVFNTALGLRPLNQLLLLAYYTASRLKHPGRPHWMLVHSCGILREGQVLLFTGPCETGKTTVGRLCGEDFGLPLNDEMMLLSWPRPEDDILLAQSTPIFGELPFRTDTAAPLSSVFLLKQSQRTALRRLDRMEAYLRFLHQVMSPAGFKNPDTRTIISIMDSFASAVTRTTPFFELEFTRDRDLLWDVEAGLKELMVTEAMI